MNIPSNCKFSMLAVQNVRADLPKDGFTLPNGTLVLTSIPFEIDDRWRTWLGSVVVDQLKACNMVFLRTATSGWDTTSLVVMDGLNEQLRRETYGLFGTLPLFGTIEYEEAFRFDGYVKDGEPDLRSYARLDDFRATGGYFPWAIREADLQAALKVHEGREALAKRFPDGARWRVWRGHRALNTGLQSTFGSDRLHNFIRALEALILPETGKTEKQFIGRCLMFNPTGGSQTMTRSALQEAYRMRSDVEHMHDWDRSLVAAYGTVDCRDIALLRTRQMEMLACWAYRQLFTNATLQAYFASDADIEKFWSLSESDVRSIIGATCDITTLPKVSASKLGWNGRADPSEWPAQLFNSLRRTA